MELRRTAFFKMMICCLLAHILFFGQLHAQADVFTQFNRSNSSLSGNNVYNMAVDSLGYVWLVTDRGNYRYNGSSMESVPTLDSVSDYENVNILYDKGLYLWFLGNNGILTRLDIISLKAVNMLSGFRSSKLERIGRSFSFGFKDDKGGYTFLSNSVNFAYRLKDNKVSVTHIPNIYKNRSYHQYLAHAAEAAIALPGAALFNGLPVGTDERKHRVGRYNCFILDNKILFKKNNKLYYLYNGDDYGMNMQIVNFFIHKNDLYIPCFAGGGCLLRYKNYMTTGRAAFADTIISGDYYTDVVVDKTESLWVSSMGSGVFYLIPGDRSIKKIGTFDGNMVILKLTVLKDRILLFNGKGETHILKKGDVAQPFSGPATASAYNRLSGLIDIPDGIIALWDKILIEIKDDKQNDHFTVRKQNFLSVNEGVNVKNFAYYTASDRLIYGYKNQLYISNLAFENVVTVRLPDYNIGCLSLSNDSICYIGTTTGILSYNVRTNKAVSQIANGEVINSLGQARHKLWYIDKFGLHYRNLFIAPDKDEAAGRLLAFFKGETVSMEKVKYGLLLMSQRKMAYIPDDVHISPSCINLDNTSIKGVIAAATFDKASFVVAINNTIYAIDTAFGKMLNKEIEGAVSGVWINSLRANDYRFVSRLFSDNDVIKIGIDIFSSNDGLVKEYRLQKKEDEQGNWIAMPENAIAINYLKPGDYYWQIRVRNTTNGKQKTWQGSIEIIPRWYQTWVFMIGLALLSLSLTAGIFWFSQKKISAQKNKENQTRLKIAELEMRSVRNQMNPHFIFNALNPLQHLIFKSDPLKASRYLNIFSKLMRRMIAVGKDSTISIKEKISFLDDYLSVQQERLSHSFDYHFYYDARIAELIMPSMLLQPIVENCIEHGLRGLDRPGNVTVTFQYDAPPVLVVTIKDNGHGTDLNMEQLLENNHALSMIKERLDLMNTLSGAGMSSSISIRSEKEHFFEVTLTLNLQQLI